MKFLTFAEAAKLACREAGKWGLYIYLNRSEIDSCGCEEILDAAPYLRDRGATHCLMDDSSLILCDSEDECSALFWQTVGDDGPTPANSYNGPARVYALTISPDGEFRNENT